MQAPRRLWTGPPRAGLLERLLTEPSLLEGGTWITATPLARDQLAPRLILSKAGPTARAYCWDDLWRLARREAEDGPAWLSPSSARLVFQEAVREARSRRRITEIVEFLRFAGYQSRLRQTFRAWTLQERPARQFAGEANDPRLVAELALFETYRQILERLNADDDAGMTVWAADRLAKSPRFWSERRDPGPIVFHGLSHPSPAQWRIIERAAETPRPVHVLLMHDPEPALADAYLASDAIRARLLDLEFVETPVEAAGGHGTAGLAHAAKALFWNPPALSPPIETSQGLAVRGAPLGEAVSRVVCREVWDLGYRGVPPEEILILYREWSDQAELDLETLCSWGLPAVASETTPLITHPTVSTLRLAASIPIRDWETELIIRLLRNGQLRPEWPNAEKELLVLAASAIKQTDVFRGREELNLGMERWRNNLEPIRISLESADLAQRLVERLLDELLPLDGPRSWPKQAAELRRLARLLGLNHDAIEPLWDALNDHAELLERLGASREPWTWTDFLEEVDAILAELRSQPPSVAGAVRLATVDQADGFQASHVILADLAEGTFPAREAVEPFLQLGPDEKPSASHRMAFSREALRFLRVLDGARVGVILAYPTTDSKGQELLRAGFLEELLERLPKAERAACEIALPRLDLSLVDHPDLARSAADKRVRALAIAAERQEFGELERLAGRSTHRAILNSTAAAIFAQRHRLRGNAFSEFEGLLKDGTTCMEVDRLYGESPCFTASQLETYISCPFQFFSKYVLRLTPIEQRDELDEDYTLRGSQLHDVLENFETLLKQASDEMELEEIANVQIEQVLKQDGTDLSDLARGLQEIERGRIRRSIGMYVVQRRAYDREGEESQVKFRPHKLELSFGELDSEHPMLEIRQGSRSIRLRGRIDRIDLAETSEGLRFRVIDYKSGLPPSPKNVRQGEMLQLPLYAMAVQEFAFDQDMAALFDLGYWSLKKDGFKPIRLTEWNEDQRALIDHVLNLVDRLRQGVFPVASRKPNCDDYCDFRGVCRIQQIRNAGKQLDLSFPELRTAAPSRKKPTGRDADS